MYNEEIRRYAAGKGVRLWQVADELGIADTSLSRKLRKDLPADSKREIRRIIDKLAKEAS